MDTLTPSAASPRASSRKRTATFDPDCAAEDALVDVEPARKKRAPRSTAAEKQAKKLARMERNRLAAQVSRDKKKHQAEYLEARVAELEAQLVQPGGSSSSSMSPSPFSVAGLPPTPTSYTLPPPATAATSQDATVERLRNENETLKTQLALERLQCQSLQIRLSALENKFGRLEQLLAHQAGSTTQVKQEEDAHEHMSTEVAVPPVAPSFADVDLDALLGLDFGAAPVAPVAPVAAPDPFVHSDLGAPGAALPNDVVAQAWADWAGGLDPAAFPAAEPALEAVEPEFDLFEFLRQDAGSAAAVAC